jgi:hypothetical protein
LFYHFRLLVILDKFPIIGIFFTAYFSHLDSEWEKKIGENYFIQKPIKNKDLIRRITGIINKN